MNTYKAGTRCFCDFHFGGKPKAKCIEVIQPGSGKSSGGRILVEITETAGGYKKGQRVELDSFIAVPVKQEFRKRGSCFRWINTNYQWI